jgi:TonB-dependent SusC/RagA subfamily outer membrane receptor
MIKIVITLGLFLGFIIKIDAQEKIIVGKITAFQSIPLNHAKIYAKKSGKETFSDEKGFFSINCKRGDILIVEATGFAKVKLKVEDIKDTLNANLYFFNSIRNRELAVSNGYINKNTLDDAIANLPNQKEDYSKFTDVFELIKTKFPFVQVKNGTFFIPPAGFNVGEVLLVFNGVEVNDISFIAPRDVKSIKVLKGPDASIYGVRGGNGVIEVWTTDQK